MEDARRTEAEKEAADAERLIAAWTWNERQAKRMPMLFAPTHSRRAAWARLAQTTIGAARIGKVRRRRGPFPGQDFWYPGATPAPFVPSRYRSKRLINLAHVADFEP
jgi:hypothetical protein